MTGGIELQWSAEPCVAGWRESARFVAGGLLWQASVIHVPDEIGWHWYLSAIEVRQNERFGALFREEIDRGFRVATSAEAKSAAEVALRAALEKRGIVGCA